jgi:predicted NBD/HSP70 family sugar kinase
MPTSRDVALLAEKSSSPRPTHATGASEPSSHAKAALLLLRLLRATQPTSRAEMARRLGVNRSTVTDTFKPLIASGVVREDEAQPVPAGKARPLGRRATALSFNDRHDFFVGVNLGARSSQVGLASPGGGMIAEEEFDTPRDAADALHLVRATIARLSSSAPRRRLRVIGVSVPGPTDAARGRLLYAPHLGWQDVSVADALRFDSRGQLSLSGEAVPVVVENDSTAAAIYEARLHLRKAEGLDDFILVRSGTGVGVGLVLGGEVYRGTGVGAGLAGEFGHMTIVAGGKQCVCGNRGCWERYASASAASSLYMGERAQLGGISPPRYVEIVARAEGGELRAQRTLARVGEYLGIGIANVIMGLGVPRVIVSGRVVFGWKFIRGPLHDAVSQSMVARISGWSVEPGEPTGAGLGGAVEVAADEYIASLFA